MMTLDDLWAHLLPSDDHLTFQSLIIEESRFILVAALLSAHSTCPDCRQPTHRIHGHYPRTLADLPWATAPIELRVIVRRFRGCPCPCRRQTFAERFPRVAPLYARTTTRVATTQANTGVVLGGAAGARHLSRPGAPVSRTTLLRRVRSVSWPEGPAPPIIGIDDWAGRTGNRYGAISVDLQRGGPIDGLEERAAATVATGLPSHPDVTIVARDRAEASAAGIRHGAPEATPVADRCHLRKNWAAALHEVFNAHPREMAQLPHVPHNEPPTPENDSVTVPMEGPVTMTKAQQQMAHHRAKRVGAYDQAHALRQPGWPMKAISTSRGRHHRTVKTSLPASTWPERPPRRPSASILDPYKAYLLQRWQAGCRSTLELSREMPAQGVAGTYSLVAAYVSRLRPPQGRIPRRRTSGSPAPIVAIDKPLTPSRATWLVMRREAPLNDDEKTPRARLQAQEGAIAEAITLTQDFAALVRQRQPGQLERWLERATASGLQAFKSGAKG